MLVAVLVVAAPVVPVMTVASTTADAAPASADGSAAATASCANATFLLPYYYKADELSTGKTNATHRIEEFDVYFDNDGANFTVTFNLSSLANLGVNLSNADVVVTGTARGTENVTASLSPADANVSVDGSEKPGDGDQTAQFSIKLTGVNTSEASTGVVAYGIGIDNCRDGTFESSTTPDSDYSGEENVTLFRPVIDGDVGPETLSTGHEAVVQTVRLNGTPSEPLEPTALVVRNTGNLTAESVERVVVSYGSRWTETLSGSELSGFNSSGDGAVLNVSDRSTKVSNPLTVTVTVELTGQADRLGADETLQPAFSVEVPADDSLTAGARNVTDSNATVTVVPLGDAGVSQEGRTVGARAAYNGTFTVTNASGEYNTLVVTMGDATGPRGDWQSLGGSFADVSLANVTVTVNGLNMVNRSGSLDVRSGGSALAIPLTGLLGDGDVVQFNITNVRNPDTTGAYRVSYAVNPSGGDYRVAPPGEIQVTQGYTNGSTASVQRATAYEPPGGDARVELVVDRSLEPEAVHAANFTVYENADRLRDGSFENGTPVEVTDAAVAGNDRRVVLTVPADERNITAVSAWGTNFSVTPTERTLVEGGTNGSGYANEPAALVAASNARSVTLLSGGSSWKTVETGTYSQVAVVYPGSGILGVDWTGDGLDYASEDVAYHVRAPSVTVHAPRQDGDVEPAGVVVNWTVDAPPEYEIKVVLDDFYREQPEAIRTFDDTGRTTFENLSVGRHRVDVKLRIVEGEESATVDSVGRRFQADKVGERWRLQLPVDHLAHDGGTIYAMTYEENITAVSENGSELWNRTFDSGGEQVIDIAAADGRAYALLQNETVVAMNATTGEVRWRANYSANRPIDLAADTDHVYVGMRDYQEGTGGVVALFSANGTESWRNTSFNDGDSLTVVGDTLLTTPIPLRALWADNGSQRWRTSFTVSAITVVNGTVLAVESTCCDNLQVIDLANGNRTHLAEISHDTPIGAGVTRGPALVTTAFNYPYVFATVPNSGDLYWRYYGLYRADEFVATNDTVYSAGTDNGTTWLVAVDPPAPANARVGGPGTGYPDQNLTLDGTASDGIVESYAWSVESGATTTGETANLSAAPSGVYNVTLEVTSTTGFTDTTTRRIIVSLREGATVEAPFEAGEGVELNASTLASVADVTWQFRGESWSSATVRTPGNLSGVYRATLSADGENWTDSTRYTVAVSRGSSSWTAGKADTLTYHDGTVIGTNESTITAYDEATGEPLWTYDVSANEPELRDTDGIDVAGDVVVMTHEDYANFDYEQDVVGIVNGTKVWERTFATNTRIDSTYGGEFVGLATNESWAFVQLADGTLVALNATVTSPDGSDSSTTTPTATETSTATATETSTSTATETSTETATETNTATETATETATSTSIFSTESGVETTEREPGTSGGNGSTVWSTTSIDGTMGDVGYHDGTVYVVSKASSTLYVYALNAQDGSITWSESVPTRDFSDTRLYQPRPVLAVANDSGAATVVVAIGANVTALDSSGNQVWRRTLAGVDSPVAGTTLETVQPLPGVTDIDASGGRVTVVADIQYIVNYGGSYADRKERTRTVTFAADGERLWTNVTDAYAWSVARGGDRVFVGTGIGGDNVTAMPQPHAPPVVAVDAPRNVTVNETFTLRGAAESDTATLDAALYEWTAPDGTTFGENLTTTIAEPGTYNFTLRVTDGYGESSSRSVSVTVESEPTASLSATDVTAGPGENATVTFTLSNTGDADTSFLLNITSLPANFTIVEQSPAGGTWKDAESKWLWQTVAAGDTVQPTVTIAVPTDANGTYELEATAYTNNGAVNTTTARISTTQSIPEAIDENGNDKIDDLEVLQAIEYWRTDEPVPNTGGKTIGDLRVLDLIEMWRDNAELQTS